MKTTRRITIHAELIGPIWMPPITCSKTVTDDYDARAARMVGDTPPTLRDVIDSFMREHDGDFQVARFTPNSVIRVEWTTPTAPNDYRTHVRVTPLENLPAIRDYCTDELPEYPDD